MLRWGALLLALALRCSAQQIPATMVAVHKTGWSCFTPFACVQTHTIPVPEPGAGQALVKVSGSSVSATGHWLSRSLLAAALSAAQLCRSAAAAAANCLFPARIATS